MKGSRNWSLAGVLLALVLLAAPALGAVKQVTLAEVEAMVAQKPEEGKYVLIDSRPEIKYFEGHLPWAQSLPWQEMKERLDELPADNRITSYNVCYTKLLRPDAGGQRVFVLPIDSSRRLK